MRDLETVGINPDFYGDGESAVYEITQNPLVDRLLAVRGTTTVDIATTAVLAVNSICFAKQLHDVFSNRAPELDASCGLRLASSEEPDISVVGCERAACQGGQVFNHSPAYVAVRNALEQTHDRAQQLIEESIAVQDIISGYDLEPES